jgi:hypothetical protein
MSSKLSPMQVLRSRAAGVELNFAELVNDVANRIEKSTRGRVRVLPSARDVLVKSMAPHDDHLQRDLLSGKMTAVELTRILLGVLRAAAGPNATRAPRPRIGIRYYRKAKSSFSRYGLVRIDGRGLRAAMKLKCRYLGLC